MNGPVASLNTVWFALIAVLWTGYFVLDGFDFGVGMLNVVIGSDDIDRRLARNHGTRNIDGRLDRAGAVVVGDRRGGRGRKSDGASAEPPHVLRYPLPPAEPVRLAPALPPPWPPDAPAQPQLHQLLARDVLR